MNDILKRAEELKPEIIAWRRHIHENPEVSAVLPETSAYVMTELKKMGYEPTECGGGVTAVLEGDPNGKVFLLRADMDALPMAEESGLPFSSKNPKAAHTCGHDTHTAMLLGAAKILMENKDKVKGRVKFMFQPGEEGYNGCKQMIAAGILENPKVDAAMGIHSATAQEHPTGHVMYCNGPSMASADAFKITVTGKGAHGARPENGIDPINILCHIHSALQTINSRERPQQEPLILTIGQLVAGDACNIIPNSGFISGTIRAFNQDVGCWQTPVHRDCRGYHRHIWRQGGHRVDHRDGPTINDIPQTDELVGYVKEMLGEDKVHCIPAGMGSEDFFRGDVGSSRQLPAGEPGQQRRRLYLWRPQPQGLL